MFTIIFVSHRRKQSITQDYVLQTLGCTLRDQGTRVNPSHLEQMLTSEFSGISSFDFWLGFMTFRK